MVLPTYGKLDQFFKDPAVKAGFLLGRAGTGKSYNIRKIYEHLTNQGYRVVNCSFTNEIANQMIDGMTIHKAFGLYLNYEGKTKDNGNYSIRYMDYVIIDEYTLISKSLMGYIYKKIRDSKTKVLFVGDPYQLPSVGGKPTLTMQYTHELTEQFRNPDMQQLIDWFIWHIANNQELNLEELKSICEYGSFNELIDREFPVVLGYNNAPFHVLDNEYPQLPKEHWRLRKKYEEFNTNDLILRSEFFGDLKDTLPEWALTVHKSQGKTYQGSPLVMTHNIMKAPKHLRTRLMYVACTRGTSLPTLIMDQ